LRAVAQVFPGGELPCPDAVAVDEHVADVGLALASDHLERASLAGAVQAQQPEALLALHAEAQLVDSPHSHLTLLVALDQLVDYEGLSAAQRLQVGVPQAQAFLLDVLLQLAENRIS